MKITGTMTATGFTGAMFPKAFKLDLTVTPTPPASPVDEGALVKEFRERFVAQFIDADQTSTDNLNQIEFWEVPTDKQIEAFIQNIIRAALTRVR